MVDPLIGTVTTLPGAAIAELIAEPFDLVWIDLEHASLSASEVQDMIIGTQAAGTRAMVRMPADAHHEMARVLDAGADGVVLADVDDPAVAESAVRHMLHPPEGDRGWGPRRLSTRRRGSMLSSKPEIWAQIESEAGVGAAAAIGAVAGIGRLVVGCADLSWSLGRPMVFDSPELVTAVARVARASEEAGVAFGVAGPLDAVPDSMLTDATALIHSTDARLAAAAADAAAGAIRARGTTRSKDKS